MDIEASNEPAGSQAHEEDATRCICGNTENFGVMVQCEGCSVWQHCECVNLNSKKLPEHYFCEVCPSRSMFDDARRMDNSGLKKNTRLVPPTKLPKYSEAANSNSANQIVAHDEKPATKCIGAPVPRKAQAPSLESPSRDLPPNLGDCKSACELPIVQQISKMDEQPLESQDGGEDSGDHLPAANTKKTTTKDMDDSKSPPQVSGVSAKSPCSGPQEKSEEAAPAKQQYEDAKTTENSASADNTAKPNNTAKTTAAKSPRSSRPSSSRRRYANPAAKTQAQNNAAKEADAKITPPRTEKKRTRTRTRSSARKSDGSSSKEVDKDPPAASKDHHTVKPDTPNQPSTKRGTAGTKDASRSAAARSTPSSTNSSSNSAAPKKKTQSPTEPQGKSNKRTAGLNGASSSQPSAPVGISKLKNASGTYAIPENLIKARSYHEKTSISEMIRRVKRLSAHIIYLQIMLASEENYQETASDEARNCRAKNLARVLYTLDSPCQSRKRTRLSSSQRQNLKNLGLDCFGDDEDANLAQNRDTRGMFSLSSDASTNTDYSCSDRDSGSDYSIDLQDWRPALSVNRRRRPGLERAGDKSAPGTEGTSNTESDATSFEILDRLNVALTEFQEKFDKDSKRITSRS